MDDDYKIELLCITLSKISAYVKGCDGRTEWMYFLIENDELEKE